MPQPKPMTFGDLRDAVSAFERNGASLNRTAKGLGLTFARLQAMLVEAYVRGLVDDADLAKKFLPDRARIERVSAVYETTHSLKAAGDQLGLSHERVREIMDLGARLGWAQMRPPRRKRFTRADILQALYAAGTIRGAGRMLGITGPGVRALALEYGLAGELRRLVDSQKKRNALA